MDFDTLSSESLFPLSCSAFERYMLADDRPSHPMAGFLEVDLSGQIDVGRLRQALPLALNRHPLLHSTVQRDSGKWQWVAATQPAKIEVLEPSAPRPFVNQLVLTETTGLRIWFRPGHPRSTLFLYVHHAAADALGMLTFLIEWLCLAAGNEERLFPAAVNRLLDRENLSGIRGAFSLTRRLRNIGRYLFHRPPVRLWTAGHSEDQNRESSSAFVSVRLNREEFLKLKQAVRQRNVTLNDWLTAVMFQVIHRWNTSESASRESGPYRLVIPVNRRPEEERFLSACNKIGYKLLTRSALDLESFDVLIDSIHTEMSLVRQNPQGVHSFLKMLQLALRFGVLHRMVRGYDCFATVVFSNLGDLTKLFAPLMDVEQGKLSVGGMRIEEFRAAPPRRINTHVTVAAFTYGGELSLVTSGEGRGLSREESERFLAMTRTAILESIVSPHS